MTLPLLEIEALFERGGEVLYPIGVALLAMWTLILERILYLRTGHRALLRRVTQRWEARTDHGSWYAEQIRRGLISEVASGVDRRLELIRSLVGLCTLLGLLGTVTGMIEVFDVMARTGSSSARLMADGVSRATIPTMAGMVAALSGLFFSARLRERARRETEQAARLLARD